MRTSGTVVRGIRAPILKQGDNLVEICVNTLLNAAKNENFTIDDRDIFGITEAILARTQGNYATIDDIAADINDKFKGERLGLVFPILSRNRFFSILKGIARSEKELIVQLSYPSDEVGNPLIPKEKISAAGVNPWTDVFSSYEFVKLFGESSHPFTGVDYLKLYESAGNVSVIFANNPAEILRYTKDVLVCDIHSRKATKEAIKKAGAKTIYSLDEILTTSLNGNGYNPQYGVLGSNVADEKRIKLFPRDADIFVEDVQKLLYQKTGKTVEVLVYGDGGFKDPMGIWELADPVISPGYTSGLAGLPKEAKIKYLADSKFAELKGDKLDAAIIDVLNQESLNEFEKEGTTPRRIVDLVGSLCDLTTGSGGKGTPFVHIKGYFDHLGVK